MALPTKKIVVIITESSLENTLSKVIEDLGAHGYTITDARGKGSRGKRSSAWETESNIRIEVICDEDTAQKILAHLEEHYFDDFAMVVYILDAYVNRPSKF